MPNRGYQEHNATLLNHQKPLNVSLTVLPCGVFFVAGGNRVVCLYRSVGFDHLSEAVVKFDGLVEPQCHYRDVRVEYFFGNGDVEIARNVAP